MPTERRSSASLSLHCGTHAELSTAITLGPSQPGTSSIRTSGESPKCLRLAQAAWRAASDSTRSRSVSTNERSTAVPSGIDPGVFTPQETGLPPQQFPLPCESVGTLEAELRALGFTPVAVAELAGDASRRRFFRVSLASGATVVAALYPESTAETARHDHEVQVWAWDRGLPVPRPLGCYAAVVVSEDLGDEDLAAAAATAGPGVVGLALDALAAFQECGWSGLPNAPFDAAFFRAELAVFEEFALPGGIRARSDVATFLDRLATSLAQHPYRLAHRDFHLNNLILFEGKARVVDFQDMRAGPDTYDLASLLRERGGVGLTDEAGVQTRASARFGWRPGWERRYLECAAQRGLKVIGTFLRLAALAHTKYLAWLPAVYARSTAVLEALEAPHALRETLANLAQKREL
jgi:aminoglycoside/choline kinase family phosphotransferase